MWWIIIIIIAVIAAVYVVIGFYFSQVVTRKVCNQEELYENQIMRGLFDKEEYEKLPKEEAEIVSKDGIRLRGIYIQGDKSLHRTMIFVHGITAGIPCSIKYIHMFTKRGWNVLMYDQRRHGSSEGKYSTYGYYEKEDLDLWVQWVVKRNGENSILGLHGESMGAATVLQYIPINKFVSFVIADCSYSNLNELLRYRMKEDYHLPSFPLVNLTSLRAMRKAGFSFRDISPIDAVKNSSLPVLFIHGSADSFVPCYMSKDMHNVKKDSKRLYIAEGAEHACSFEVDRERYEKEVMDFIDEVHH